MLPLVQLSHFCTSPAARDEEKSTPCFADKVHYLACAVQTALVNAAEPSLPNEAFIPEVLRRGCKLAEGEGLRRDGIAVGVLENRELLLRAGIAFGPRLVCPCAYALFDMVKQVKIQSCKSKLLHQSSRGKNNSPATNQWGHHQVEFLNLAIQ